MLANVRCIAQVTLLTAVLVFGALLIVGSFDSPGWSDAHHGWEHTWTEYVAFCWIHLDITMSHTRYLNGDHDD